MSTKNQTQATGRGSAAHRRPVISLLTDFGHQDPFVGIMKGVILGLCPEAALVDLCHETPAYNILAASFLLHSALRFFPPGTIHLAVVDPGVGGPRRPIVARIDDQVFVAPDNGLLSYPMARGRLLGLRVVAASEYLLHPVSATFHGRDVFAPVAGHLAGGLPMERVGPEIADPVRLRIPRPLREASGAMRGEVLWVDRFGNCITDITREDLGRLVGEGPGQVRVLVAGRLLGPLVGSFGEAGGGGRGAVIGSTDHLELFSNQGHLAREWDLAAGASVRLERLVEPGVEGGTRAAG